MNPFVAAAWVFAASLLSTILVLVVHGARGSAGVDIVSGTLCQVVAYSLVLFAILRVHSPGSGIRDFVGMRPTSVAFFPLAAVFGVASAFPASALAWLVTRRFPIENDGYKALTEAVLAASPGQRAMMALMVCVLGPLVEEVIFRGAIFAPQKRSLSTRGVVLMTAVLFAFVHLQWQTFLPIAILGVCLGLLRAWSGSLIVSVLAHSAFNAVALYAMTVPPPPVEEPPSLVFVVAGTFLTALSLFLSWFVARRSDVAKRAREQDA